MVSKLALILVGTLATEGSSEKLPSFRKNSSSRRSMAKPPATWKKPKASMCRLPEARINSPWAPFMLRVRVLATPVATCNAVLRALAGFCGSVKA